MDFMRRIDPPPERRQSDRRGAGLSSHLKRYALSLIIGMIDWLLLVVKTALGSVAGIVLGLAIAIGCIDVLWPTVVLTSKLVILALKLLVALL